MPISTDVVNSNLDQGEVYNIMWLSLSVTCDRSVVFSGPPVSYTNKTDRHDITEKLLKVALKTIKQTKTNKLSKKYVFVANESQVNSHLSYAIQILHLIISLVWAIKSFWPHPWCNCKPLRVSVDSNQRR